MPTPDVTDLLAQNIQALREQTEQLRKEAREDRHAAERRTEALRLEIKRDVEALGDRLDAGLNRNLRYMLIALGVLGTLVTVFNFV